jgi:arylsulfatase A-like enzyme
MRFGMITVNVGKLPEGEINLPAIAKAKGYTTGHFGKWHLGTMTRDPELSGPSPGTTAERYAPPWVRGYDDTFTTETNVATWDPLDETGLRIPKHRCHFWSNGEKVKEAWEGSSEKIIMDRAIPFMEEAVAEGTPFMTTIWFYGPHSPTRAGEELRALYPDLPLGEQHYRGSITAIDREVGRMRARLEALGISGETLIFFCSDNGPEGSGTPGPEYDPYAGVYYGNAGAFRGRKRTLYNGGVCVPAFAVWPDVIEAGRVVEDAVCTLDYLPTMIELLGYEMPDARPLDGESLLEVLEGKPWRRGKAIPIASRMLRSGPDAALIRGKFKLLVHVTREGADELYDMAADPSESRNVLVEHPETAAEMKRELMAWLESARHSFEEGDYPGYERQGLFLDRK